MYRPLAPCQACRRHIRATEAICPFCASADPRSTAPADMAPGLRLSRAALVVFSTSVALGACDPGSSGASGASGPSTPTSNPTQAVRPTEPPGPQPSASATAGPPARPTSPAPTRGPDDNGSVHAEYGAPVRR